MWTACQQRNSKNRYVTCDKSKRRRGIVVELPDETAASLSILFVNTGGLVPIPVKIKTGKNSSLSISEFFLSDAGAAGAVAPMHDITTKKGSKMELNILHNENPTTDVLHFCKGDVKEGANLRLNFMYNGGRITRARNSITASESVAVGQVNETIISASGQRFDLLTNIDNAAPSTVCNSETKAVLSGGSSGYVKGFAKISCNANKSTSNVKQRGLLLDGSHVDLIPDMSIEENDVKATHSCASAPPDQNALFYLTSRGIDMDHARMFIIDGFLAELLSRIENIDFRNVAFALMRDKVRFGKFGHVPELHADYV